MILVADFRNDTFTTSLGLDNAFAEFMNVPSRIAEAVIDVADFSFPEELGSAEIFELLERPTDIAECFVFLVLPGELLEFKVNITELRFEASHGLFGLPHLRLQRLLVEGQFFFGLIRFHCVTFIHGVLGSARYLGRFLDYRQRYVLVALGRARRHDCLDDGERD